MSLLRIPPTLTLLALLPMLPANSPAQPSGSAPTGGSPAADSVPGPIDWNHAQELFRRHQGGDTLSAEDQAYLQRAMAARDRGEGPFAVRAGQAQGPLTPRDHVGLTPLTEMGPDQKYKGEDGGLYGGGRNTPPPGQLKAALAEAARIAPLDAAGQPSPGGKIVMLSVGMSNTTMEFSEFKKLADADPKKAPDLVIVDCAQGGQAAAQWVTEPQSSHVWKVLDERLKSAGVTPPQVQAAWIKQANMRPTEPFPGHAQKLEADIAACLHRLKATFPNLRLVYLSSRIFAGYSTGALNPEPYAYESAFADRDLILKQIGGDPELNDDPRRGEVKSPLLLWGPYFWADGVTPRRSDGLVWKREDFREDGTHPSVASGEAKVAGMLLAFFTHDPTARPWFVAGGGTPAAK